MKQYDELSKALSGSQGQSIEAAQFYAPGSRPESATTAQEKTPAGPRLTGDLQGKTKSARWWHSQFNLMLAVFGLLVVTAVLFVLLAPPPEIRQPAYSIADVRLPDAEAPWTQSQLSEARAESQNILATLLDAKQSLEEKGVQNWAPERFQQALELAAQGDEFYKERDFAQAIMTYQNAVDQMESLYDLLPMLIRARLEEGQAAINAGKSALAKQLFEQALVLEENSIQAIAGLDRASKLDQVLQLISTAADLEGHFAEHQKLESLLAAEQNLVQAKGIDALFAASDVALARVRQTILEKRFQKAMSDAYRALFANRYGAAQIAFSAALKIKPGDTSAKAALRQALASDKTASLSSLLATAKRFEQQEEWANAQSNYQTVLQRDPNQVSARLGNIRTGARATLDSEIRKALSDTLSFSQSEGKAKATKVLREARAMQSKGSRLLDQIAQLEAALQQADTLIKVSFLSDSLTDISLQKEGSTAIKLGYLSQRNLALKPGRYVATGIRLGYQDVRNEIEIHPGSKDIESITVKCDRPIGLMDAQGNSNGWE